MEERKLIDFRKTIEFLQKEQATFTNTRGWEGRRILTPRGAVSKIQEELGNISSSTITNALAGGSVTTILAMNIRRLAIEYGGNYENI